MGRILAAADIGSNTVHMLVAEVNATGIRRIRNDSEWLSLGEVVSRLGEIPPDIEARLIEALRIYKTVAQGAKAQALYCFATEAMRIAANHAEVLQRIEKQTKIKVELIAPRREAELSLRGTTLDSNGGEPAVLVEVGGGSAQVAQCQGRTVIDDVSLPVGTGKLIASSGLTYPCTKKQLASLSQIVNEALDQLKGLEPAVRIVASGGVARGIWRALHPDGERTLALQELEYIEWAAQRLNIDQICLRFGVKQKRAATMVPGSMVYSRIMKKLNQNFLTVSEFGVREGAVLEMAAGSVRGSAL